MKQFIFTIGKIVSLFIPLNISNHWKAAKVYFTTGYKSRYFKYFGEKSIIGLRTSFCGEKFISIGKDVVLNEGVRIHANYKHEYSTQDFEPEIRIGNNCNIGHQSHITAINKVVIGNNVLTGPSVLITDNAHGESKKEVLHIPPHYRALSSKGPVVIEDNVWIGEGAMIMPNVHIGYGAIIASNSVVTTDVPAYCVVAGIPAKVLKQM